MSGPWKMLIALTLFGLIGAGRCLPFQQDDQIPFFQDQQSQVLEQHAQLFHQQEQQSQLFHQQGQQSQLFHQQEQQPQLFHQQDQQHQQPLFPQQEQQQQHQQPLFPQQEQQQQHQQPLFPQQEQQQQHQQPLFPQQEQQQQHQQPLFPQQEQQQQHQQPLFPQQEQQQHQQHVYGPEDYPELPEFPSGSTLLSGFTISCNGADRACVRTDLCVGGYVQYANVQSSVGRSECRVNEETCCTIRPAESGTSKAEQKLGPGEQTGTGGAVSGPNFVTFAPPLQLGCAAALLCVEEHFCTLEGMISPEPVVLTEKQLLRRVPLSSCKNQETGLIGRCCRDPNYVDPWPTGGLPKNYTGGFDEQGFPTFLNIAKVKPPKKTSSTKNVKAVVKQTEAPKTTAHTIPVTTPPLITTPDLPPVTRIVVTERPHLIEDVQSPVFTTQNTTSTIPLLLVPPQEVNKLEVPDLGVLHTESSNKNSVSIRGQCGIKNNVARIPGMEESETMFGEIPWQAMVLHAADRKILCSGVLVDTSTVLTAANCVHGLAPSEISIKLGEWKLGYELKQEEPLPFEIFGVSSLNIHPAYTNGYAKHDLALLTLNQNADLNFHINPLCLPEVEYVPAESRCIATGWGKLILQSHYAGAKMQAVTVDILNKGICDLKLLNEGYDATVASEAICGTPEKERNNVCQADVGGPLACDTGNGIYQLSGVYSMDNGCQATEQVAVFAPIDMKWVNTVIQRTEKTEIELSTDDSTFRKSTLSANNQYLPPN